MSLRRTVRFRVGFSVEFLSVGGSEIFSNVKTSVWDVGRWIEEFRRVVGLQDAFCDYYDYLGAVLRARKKSFLAVERVVVDGRVEPAILGSSVKGVVRHAIDKLFLEQIVADRVKVLSLREDFVGEVKRLLKSARYRGVYERVRKAVKGVLKVGDLDEDVVDRVITMYFLYVSPYSCLAPSLDVLSCGLPLHVERLALFKKLNRLLVGQKVGGCVDVGGEIHCLPLDRLCVTCTLFGCSGVSSLVRFSTFRIASECQSALITFNRVFAGDRFVSPFTLEVLGFKQPVYVRGVVSVDVDPDRIKHLLSLSYALYARHSVSVGGVTLNVAEHVEKLFSCDGKTSCFVEVVESLYENVLRAAFEALKQGIVGFGHRTRLGFGRVLDYTISVE